MDAISHLRSIGCESWEGLRDHPFSPLHFTDEEPDAQREEVTCSMSSS